MFIKRTQVQTGLTQKSISHSKKGDIDIVAIDSRLLRPHIYAAMHPVSMANVKFWINSVVERAYIE